MGAVNELFIIIREEKKALPLGRTEKRIKLKIRILAISAWCRRSQGKGHFYQVKNYID